MWPLFAMGVATTFGAVGAYRLQERAQVARAKAEIMVGISKVFLLGNWALDQLSGTGGSSFAARQRMRGMVQQYEETQKVLADLSTGHPELRAERQQNDGIETSGIIALIDGDHAAWAASARTAIHALQAEIVAVKIALNC